VGAISRALVDAGVLTAASARKQRLGADGRPCGVAWHMTVANTKYADRARQPGQPRPAPLDMVRSLEADAAAPWEGGLLRVRALQLCRLGGAGWWPARREPGAYAVECEVPLTAPAAEEAVEGTEEGPEEETTGATDNK
jgi:hypothetical protein